VLAVVGVAGRTTEEDEDLPPRGVSVRVVAESAAELELERGVDSENDVEPEWEVEVGAEVGMTATLRGVGAGRSSSLDELLSPS